ncbi:hypothetical protein HNR70_001156 [Brachybacterium aquaticum]|uniref:Uncharacterized protein n=1 Tax=Brachybacterium aquaticum TaxID=1432564 RepID=A0A841ABN0_9MICO|nr:hypothetical protein [Brachybacterium aquaticum]
MGAHGTTGLGSCGLGSDQRTVAEPVEDLHTTFTA